MIAVASLGMGPVPYGSPHHYLSTVLARRSSGRFRAAQVAMKSCSSHTRCLGLKRVRSKMRETTGGQYSDSGQKEFSEKERRRGGHSCLGHGSEKPGQFPGEGRPRVQGKKHKSNGDEERTPGIFFTMTPGFRTIDFQHFEQTGSPILSQALVCPLK